MRGVKRFMESRKLIALCYRIERAEATARPQMGTRKYSKPAAPGSPEGLGAYGSVGGKNGMGPGGKAVYRHQGFSLQHLLLTQHSICVLLLPGRTWSPSLCVTMRPCDSEEDMGEESGKQKANTGKQGRRAQREGVQNAAKGRGLS